MKIGVSRAHAWMAVAMLAVAGCSSGGGSSGPEERIVVAEGTTLHLLRFDGQQLVEVDTAAIPSEGLLGGHTIFGIMKHPAKNWLYVSSFNECGSDSDFWCWGNARIDRFTVSKGAISYAGPAYVYDANSPVTCATEDASEYPGQVGWCAPVNGGFSADGTRLYVKEDDNDDFSIFEVGADGRLSFVAESLASTIDLHGMAANPTAPYVYNGTSVLGVDADEPVVVLDGTGGNDTRVIARDGADDLLLTTLGTSGFGFYSLADPAAPVVVSSVTLASNQSRALAVTDDLSRVVTVGRNYVGTFSFDGNALANEDAYAYTSGAAVENRSVTLVDGGSHAVVGWFVNTAASPSGALGGVTVYAIDRATGVLAPAETVAFLNGTRVVTALEVQ